MTEGRRSAVSVPAHLGVILGLSTGAYALTLAAVTGLQSSAEAATRMGRAPTMAAIDAMAADHDRLTARLDAARAAYEAAAGVYGIVRGRFAHTNATPRPDLGRFVVVELSAKVAKRAGELAERRGLRGFDAIHLASALEVEELTGLMPDFYCYDVRLREAASDEGLAGSG